MLLYIMLALFNAVYLYNSYLFFANAFCLMLCLWVIDIVCLVKMLFCIILHYYFAVPLISWFS